MCAMEPVTYDHKAYLYDKIHSTIINFHTCKYFIYAIWHDFKTKYMLELRYLIYKLYYLFCYMNK